ncbi:WD40 repeat domain-containing protein [Aspergillus mulundensis]|uniref:Uncharacterized protein n=1 Tax=Aspergillus mulundensis TaxID=1810919 RepID=A0A3D8RFE0_9EURO|nr:hypothetical protein DSM5745_07852 [Aspergillus mulundensis]RDW72680.1 hypothetical protein DSM5745_07852 [Aspergillus mulundensis]
MEVHLVIWDISSGCIRRRFKLKKPDLDKSFTFSPNSRQLIIASGKELLIWDMVNDWGLRRLASHDVKFRHVIFTHNGRFISDVWYGSTVIFKACAHHSPPETQVPIGNPKWWVRVSKNVLEIFDSDPTKPSSKPLLLLHLTKSYTALIVFTLDGRKLIKFDDDDYLVWNLQSGEVEPVRQSLQDFPKDVAFLHDGTMLAAGRGLNHWEVDVLGTGEVNEAQAAGPDVPRVQKVVLTPGSRHAAVLWHHPAVEIFDFATLKRISTVKVEAKVILDMTPAQNSGNLVLFAEHRILIYNIAKKRLEQEINSTYTVRTSDGECHLDSPPISRLSDDGTKVAWVANWDSEKNTSSRVVHVGSVKTGEVLHTSTPMDITVHDLAFSARGDCLTIRFRDGRMKRWHLSGEHNEQPLHRDPDYVKDILDNNPPGTSLDSEGWIFRHGLRTLYLRQDFREHAVSRDGNCVAIARSVQLMSLSFLDSSVEDQVE